MDCVHNNCLHCRCNWNTFYTKRNYNMVCLPCKTWMDSSKLGSRSNMEYAIYFNWNSPVPYLEERCGKKRCTDGSSCLCCSTHNKCGMVTGILRIPQHIRRSSDGNITMDSNSNQHIRILPYIQTCWTAFNPILSLGEHSSLLAVQPVHTKPINYFFLLFLKDSWIQFYLKVKIVIQRAF